MCELNALEDSGFSSSNRRICGAGEGAVPRQFRPRLVAPVRTLHTSHCSFGFLALAAQRRTERRSNSSIRPCVLFHCPLRTGSSEPQPEDRAKRLRRTCSTPGLKTILCCLYLSFLFPRDLDSEHVRAFSICVANRLESRRQSGAVNNLKLILYISIGQGRAKAHASNFCSRPLLELTSFRDNARQCLNVPGRQVDIIYFTVGRA